MAYMVMANIFMAYIVMAHLVLAYIVMAYIAMAYIVMAAAIDQTLSRLKEWVPGQSHKKKTLEKKNILRALTFLAWWPTSIWQSSIRF